MDEGDAALVVEDDASVREFLSELLTAQGYGVVTAADGAEARDAVAASLPALVILDLLLIILFLLIR